MPNDDEGGQSPAHEDRDLVTRAMRAHRPSFDALVHRTARLVWSQIALHLHNDRPLIDDLVQETFLRAWRHIHTLDSPDRFRPWLIAIAQRVRLDEHKRKTRVKRSSPAPSTNEPDESPAPTLAFSPEAQATLNEEKQRAIEAMHALPEQYRDVLALRYLGGAGTEEIARQLALTPGSVRGLLHRGLELLRQQLSPQPRPAAPSIAAGGAA